MRGAASIVIALAVGGCDRKAAAPPPPPPMAPAPTLDAAPPPVDAAPTHSIGGLDVERIDAKAPPPKGAPARAVVVGGVRWTDRTGPGAVYLLEVASIDRRSIALWARSVAGADERLVREVKDRADACPERNLTGFAPPSVTVTDVDGDGLAEVGFGYLLGCGGGAVVVKQLLLEGDDKYIVRGSSPGGGAPEPDAAAWPAGGLALADAAYRDNAGALDVADTVGPTTAPTIYDRDSDVEDVELTRTSGAVDVALSYPKLPMLARSEAGELTTRMRAFLRVDERWPRDRAGRHQGACTIALITPLVVSVECELSLDTWPRREQDHAARPPATTLLGITVWRTPGHELVTSGELGVAPSGCPWILEPDGLVAPEVVDDAHPCAAERVPWSQLTPASDRAKALIAAMPVPAP